MLNLPTGAIRTVMLVLVSVAYIWLAVSIIATLLRFLNYGSDYQPTATEMNLMLPLAVVRAALYLAVAGLCFVRPRVSVILAWTGVAIYFVPAFLEYGLNVFSHQIPAFSKSVANQVAHAVVLTVLIHVPIGFMRRE